MFDRPDPSRRAQFSVRSQPMHLLHGCAPYPACLLRILLFLHFVAQPFGVNHYPLRQLLQDLDLFTFGVNTFSQPDDQDELYLCENIEIGKVSRSVLISKGVAVGGFSQVLLAHLVVEDIVPGQVS